MEEENSARELEKISDLFISASEKKETSKEDLSESEGIQPAQGADESEVEETVSVRRRIAYPDTENAQANIKKCLLRHLEEDYVVCRVELRKASSAVEGGTKKTRKEEILLFLKESKPY